MNKIYSVTDSDFELEEKEFNDDKIVLTIEIKGYPYDSVMAILNNPLNTVDKENDRYIKFDGDIENRYNTESLKELYDFAFYFECAENQTTEELEYFELETKPFKLIIYENKHTCLLYNTDRKIGLSPLEGWSPTKDDVEDMFNELESIEQEFGKLWASDVEKYGGEDVRVNDENTELTFGNLSFMCFTIKTHIKDKGFNNFNEEETQDLSEVVCELRNNYKKLKDEYIDV